MSFIVTSESLVNMQCLGLIDSACLLADPLPAQDLKHDYRDAYYI